MEVDYFASDALVAMRSSPNSAIASSRRATCGNVTGMCHDVTTTHARHVHVHEYHSSRTCCSCSCDPVSASAFWSAIFFSVVPALS